MVYLFVLYLNQVNMFDFAARTREAEAVVALENVPIEITQMRNSLNRFLDWCDSSMTAPLNTFDSYIVLGGPLFANPGFSITH